MRTNVMIIFYWIIIAIFLLILIYKLNIMIDCKLRYLLRRLGETKTLVPLIIGREGSPRPVLTAVATKTRSPHTIGLEVPWPSIATFQATFFSSLHSSGCCAVRETPLFSGPRHWCQFCPTEWRPGFAPTEEADTTQRRVRKRSLMIFLRR